MTRAAQDLSKGKVKTFEMPRFLGLARFLLLKGVNKESEMEDSKTTDMADALTPDWTHIQSWLQNAAMELDYLVWLVIAKRMGAMPDEAPTLYKIEADLEEEPLTEDVIRRRLKEIVDLADGWRTNDGFPQF